MRLGSTVTGSITLSAPPGVEVPASALTEADGRPAVWVVDPQSQTVSLRNVDVLRYDPATVVVSQGLDDRRRSSSPPACRRCVRARRSACWEPRDEPLQPLRMGDPAPFAGDLFHARHRRRGRRILPAARAERGSGLHRQDHGRAGRLARAPRSATRSSRSPTASRASSQETPNLDYLKSYTTAGQATIFVNLKDSTPAGQGAGHLVSGAQEGGRHPQRRCRKASSAPASTTSSATPTASSTASPPTASRHRELRDYVDDVRKQLLELPDISKIDVLGAQDERVYVEFSTAAAGRPRDRPRRADRRAAGAERRHARRRRADRRREDPRPRLGRVPVRAGHARRQLRRERPDHPPWATSRTSRAAPPTRRSRCSASTDGRASGSPSPCARAATCWRSGAMSSAP